jgi:hypothetical protein
VRWRKYLPGLSGLHNAARSCGYPLVIRSSAQALSARIAYEPRTGKEHWQVKLRRWVFKCAAPGLRQRAGSSSAPDFSNPRCWQFVWTGRGDVTKSHIAWTLKRGVSLTPSPLLVGDELYMVSDNGIASCV